LQLEERLIRFIEGGRAIDPPQSMISTNYINEAKCSSIKEGPNVNLHITTPAALLAISLMYLKSNDKELAARITIPNSFNTI
jgi:anaphase-promoting complex subunit 1